MRIREFYAFTSEIGNFYYTSADEEIVYDGNTYVPVSIQRNDLSHTGELAKANLQVTMPVTDDSLTLADSASDYTFSVTLFKLEDETALVNWKGRITTASLSGGDIKFECESILTSLRRTGLRRIYQRPCPFALYAEGCRVPKASFQTAGTIAAVSGKTITVNAASGQADGYYTGGMVKLENKPYRFITNHTSGLLTLSRLFREVTIGENVLIYPGCAHDMSTCNVKFNNLDNYGGFPWVPTKNPFGMTSIV